MSNLGTLIQTEGILKEKRFEMGGNEYIAREMTGEAFKKYQNEIITIRGQKDVTVNHADVMIAMIANSLCGDDGKKLVNNAADRQLLSQLPQNRIQVLFDHCCEVNGINETAETKKS